MQTNTKTNWFAAWVSMISNVLLTIMKIAVGFLFRSEVLIADGVHNAGDVIASTAAMSSMRISNRPADHDHPYGHGKAEVLASAFVAFILGLAAVYIGYESISALFDPAPEAHFIALLAAFVSLVWKQVLYVYTIRIGKKSNSKGLIATAYDHLADVYASIAAVIGIGLGLIGGWLDIDWLSYGDPIAGFIVALLVLKMAIKMALEATDILMEKNIDPELLTHFHGIVMSVPQVKRIDRLRAREHGHYILVDIRVGLHGDLTIKQGHDIGRSIKQALIQAHPRVDEVLVHINPWYANKSDSE